MAAEVVGVHAGEPERRRGSRYTNCSMSTSACSASANVLPDSTAPRNAPASPYDVFIPHDLQARMVCLWSAGMSRPMRIWLTTLGTEPTDIAKSTTQVGPYMPP